MDFRLESCHRHYRFYLFLCSDVIFKDAQSIVAFFFLFRSFSYITVCLSWVLHCISNRLHLHLCSCCLWNRRKVNLLYAVHRANTVTQEFLRILYRFRRPKHYSGARCVFQAIQLYFQGVGLVEGLVRNEALAGTGLHAWFSPSYNRIDPGDLLSSLLYESLAP